MLKRPTPQWLREAVFYEVYPQSFCDSNGDGIGDLPGLIGKLDYIAGLGCTAIWINPCFSSPFRDAGYDIDDFYKVAPRYGTNDDLKRLFVEAKARGIRVVLDLVAGHTASTHPWFVESCKAEPNKYSNWYIWTRRWTEPGGAGNWINGHAERDGRYMANFFYHQPALNYGYHNPDPNLPWQLPVDHPDVQAVRAELRNIIRFWLDMGAAGFRVDMAASLCKNDPEHCAVSEFWREVRAWLDRDYPEAVLISEWGKPQAAISAGFHVDLLLHIHSDVYNSLFRMEPGSNIHPTEGHSYFREEGQGDIELFLQPYQAMYEQTRELGFISIYSGNHDVPRLNTGRGEAELACCFAFFLTMPGVPFIYYGDEIGMRYLPWVKSVEGGYNRTGSRTPMQWNGADGAGFSTADESKFYAPLDPDVHRPSVAAQEADPASLLNSVRRLVALRRAHPALGGEGAFEAVYAEAGKYPFVYRRTAAGECCVVAVNPAASAAKLQLPALAGRWEPLLCPGVELSAAGELTMAPVSYGIFRAA
jgi:maltose alpha-D-glucosyltransferase/alpha-amylase